MARTSSPLAASLRKLLSHPVGSSGLGVWNAVILGVVLYTTFEIPRAVSIQESAVDYRNRELFLTLLYTADILINLVRLRTKATFLHVEYNALRGFYRRWVLTDILAALPLAFIFGMPWLQLFRLAKVVKAIFKLQIIKRIKARHANAILLLQTLLGVAIMTHWLSCGWIRIRGLDHDLDAWTNYIDALYWTASTLTTVGYGDITPITSAERVYAVATMIIGYSFFGYLIGSFAGILANKDPIRARFEQNLEKLTNAARYANLPLDLQRRIYEYFRYQMTRRVGYDEESFINELPPNMRAEVSLHFRKEVIEDLSIFKDAPPAFIMEIAQHLHERIIAPGESLFMVGDTGNEMFFIAHGEIEILDRHGTILRVLDDGDFFGEIALFREIPRTATARAKTYCDVYCLSKSAFDSVFGKHPDIAAQIQKKAIKRVQPGSL